MGGFALVVSLLKVAAVLGGLVLCLRLLARHQRGRTGVRTGGRTAVAPLMEVIDQSRLGRTANVVALRVGERVLLLGVTDSGIETLADVSGDIDLTVDESEEPPPGSVLDHAVDLLRTGGFKR